MDGWTDRWREDRQTETGIQREGQTYTQKKGQRDKQAGVWTDGQTDGEQTKTGIQREGQAERNTLTASLPSQFGPRP